MAIYVQVAGCFDDGECTIGGVSNQMARFFSVYLGRPGDYVCLTDFETKAEAEEMAQELIDRGVADTYDDITYDEAVH